MFTVLFLSKSLLHFQMKAETINSTTAVSLAEKLKKITDPASPVVQFSGNLFAAVAILTTLGNKTAKNPPMNEEESKQFMKVGLKIEVLKIGFLVSLFPKITVFPSSNIFTLVVPCLAYLLAFHLPSPSTPT